MAEFIPLSVPSFKGNEWTYVKECIDTEWVSSAGKYVDLFESKIEEFTKTKYAVACVNGTSALHISLLLAGVKPGDEVIVPTLTFIATVNTVRYCGAYPIFMDSDKFYNIDAEKTSDFILKETEFKKKYNGKWWTYNKKTGRRVVGIVPVHVFGNAVWLDDLVEICRERNILIIEDATHSLGTVYSEGKFEGKNAGTVGELGCLSFNGNKIITAGGGGMILTNDENYAKKARYLTTQAKDDEIYFIHNEIGYNYRLTNIQAALGVAQLEQLPLFIDIKKSNYAIYEEFINNIEGLNLVKTPGYADNNYYMYPLQIDTIKYGKSREELRKILENKKIQTRPVWYLNHLQKKFIKYQSYCIENACNLFERTLMLPCSVSLIKSQIDKIINMLKIS